MALEARSKGNKEEDRQSLYAFAGQCQGCRHIPSTLWIDLRLGEHRTEKVVGCNWTYCNGFWIWMDLFEKDSCLKKWGIPYTYFFLLVLVHTMPDQTFQCFFFAKITYTSNTNVSLSYSDITVERSFTFHFSVECASNLHTHDCHKYLREWFRLPRYVYSICILVLFTVCIYIYIIFSNSFQISLSPATEPLLPSIYHDVLYGVKAPHPLFVKRPPKSALQKMKRLSLSVTRWVQLWTARTFLS